MRVAFSELERSLAAHQRPDWDLGERIPSAVAVPLVETPTGTEVWIILRPDSMRQHARELAFPGGKADPTDASLLDTALRELHEELGIERAFTRSLGTLTSVPVATSRFAIHPFVIAVEPSARPTPAPDEVAELLRVPFQAFFEGAIEYSIVEMGTYRSPIFGFTAGRMYGASAHILLELLEICASLAAIELPPPKVAERAPWL
jgi:8-oxo-dGTP pyrophosphatase MutT (NUDIX family)